MKKAIIQSRIKEVKKFKSISLNLADLGIKEIPIEVFELTHIEHLVLGKKDQYSRKSGERNLVTAIPDEIKNLKNLKILEVCGNKIKILPEGMGELEKLTILDFTDNELTELPEPLSKLKNLYKIHLGKNKFQRFPMAITSMDNLEFLYLEENGIKELPIEILKLRKLKSLNLTDNPITLPPPEIVFRGENINAIQNFFEKLENNQTDFLYEMKLLLVGEGRVGKTSIAKSLQLSDYILEDEHSTEGIKIKPWILKKDELDKNKDYRLNIWDFGGQEIYHSTHQFFLTKRSLYILITESRKEDSHDVFYYWLNLIKLLGDQSPVMIVLNKCDQPTKELPIEGYKKVFNNIISFQKISCKPEYKDTIASLKAEIKRIITNSQHFPHLGIPLPKVWVDIRYEIEELEKKGINYISFNNYLEICEKYKQDEPSALYLSDFFHDLGVFLHFQDDFSLRDTIFLNHEWVTEGVYNVLDNRKVKENFGVFTQRDLLSIWSENQYDTKRNELLSLMKNEKFELCFELGYNKFLIPQLLPVDEIEFEWRTKDNNLKYEYEYKFMPKGILTRIIVKLHKDIYENTYWRYGVLLSYKDEKLYNEDTRALVKEDYFGRKITIFLEGPQKKTLLSLIRKAIKEIHKDFNNLEVEEMIPCSCSICSSHENNDRYKLSELIRRIERNKKTVECSISYEEVNVKGLISDIINLEEINVIDKNKIFVSYSHKDTEWLKRIEVHLKPLIRGQKLELWSDKKILVGDKWEEKINEALLDSSIALLLISADFLASDFINNNELPLLLKKAELDGTRIIPIIIDHSLFAETPNVAQFQSLNSPNRPLNSLEKSEQEKELLNMAISIKSIVS